MCLFFTLMYKTLGGYTWEGLYKTINSEECPIDESPVISSTILSDDSEKTVAQSAQELQLAFSSLKQVSLIFLKKFYTKF